ncbi:hypothetical protein IOD16_25835 [Saccharothrix sp. 6-C]|uniref:Uncharacterized protein n=1 Tax=Saccharothrix texasensis TaxID=103734 RepID=A0A3N1HFT8_9PSEU|nr:MULTISPECIES: hypothetical protein [Saccharothrix]QQQ74562.1 hypothetical protein IOD16_25835 [Saccharothrix sp. 6-C]ROP41368.1 hypothetical protein EDD40_6797 [Saccharothrix texasensis]
MELHEEQAEHVGPEFDLARQACHAAIAETPALHYLAHYSSGVFDFGMDALGDPPPTPDALPGGTRREELKRLGRHLTFQVATLDRTLQEVRTGRLIRTVLHTEEGALFCDSVVPTEHVVGLVLDHTGAGPLLGHPAVEEADRAVAGLATRLRAQLSLGSLNPGGWESAQDVAPLPVGEEVVAHVTVGEEAGAHVTAGEGPLTACLAAVRAQDLHLVAHVDGGEVRAMVDCLGDPSLAPFFKQVTVDARRRFYHGLAQEFGALTTKLNRAVNPVVGGLMARLVLDVEMGAIYYYRLRAGEYLVGVTIDQARVRAADDRMSALAEELTPIGP